MPTLRGHDALEPLASEFRRLGTLVFRISAIRLLLTAFAVTTLVKPIPPEVTHKVEPLCDEVESLCDKYQLNCHAACEPFSSLLGDLDPRTLPHVECSQVSLSQDSAIGEARKKVLEIRAIYATHFTVTPKFLDIEFPFDLRTWLAWLPLVFVASELVRGMYRNRQLALEAVIGRRMQGRSGGLEHDGLLGVYHGVGAVERWFARVPGSVLGAMHALAVLSLAAIAISHLVGEQVWGRNEVLTVACATSVAAFSVGVFLAIDAQRMNVLKARRLLHAVASRLESVRFWVCGMSATRLGVLRAVGAAAVLGSLGLPLAPRGCNGVATGGEFLVNGPDFERDVDHSGADSIGGPDSVTDGDADHSTAVLASSSSWDGSLPTPLASAHVPGSEVPAAQSVGQPPNGAFAPSGRGDEMTANGWLDSVGANLACGEVPAGNCRPDADGTNLACGERPEEAQQPHPHRLQSPIERDVSAQGRSARPSAVPDDLFCPFPTDKRIRWIGAWAGYASSARNYRALSAMGWGAYVLALFVAASALLLLAFDFVRARLCAVGLGVPGLLLVVRRSVEHVWAPLAYALFAYIIIDSTASLVYKFVPQGVVLVPLELAVLACAVALDVGGQSGFLKRLIAPLDPESVRFYLYLPLVLLGIGLTVQAAFLWRLGLYGHLALFLGLTAMGGFRTRDGRAETPSSPLVGNTHLDDANAQTRPPVEALQDARIEPSSAPDCQLKSGSTGRLVRGDMRNAKL